MAHPLLSSLPALLLPLGLMSAPSPATAGYVRSYAAARNSNGHVPGSSHHAHAAGARPRDAQHQIGDRDTPVLLPAHGVRELVIIDSAVPDKSVFYRGAKPGVDIVEIESGRSGLEQLMQVLARYQGLTALHIVSHAEEGVLYLGNSRVDAAALQREAGAFAALNGALVEGADLLLYGCDLAADEAGEALLDIIQHHTHLDVAASDNRTGSPAQGADWALEIRRGNIETELAFSEKSLMDFSAVLAPVEHSLSTFTYRNTGTTSNCPSDRPAYSFNYLSVDSSDFIGCGFMHSNGYGSATTVALSNHFSVYVPAFLKPDGPNQVSQSTVSGTNHIEIRKRTGSFQLTNVVADEFPGTSVFTSVHITGYPAAGGAPITSTAITNDTSAVNSFTFASGSALSNFAGVNLSKFRLTFVNQAGTGVDYMRLVNFTAEDADVTGPGIGAISNQTIAAGDSTGAIAFSLGDNFTPAASVNLTRASSNTSAVPLANVVLGGSGASRTVTVTGAAAGTATITITATDRSGNVTNRIFDVVVADSNHVPVNSVIPAISGTATVGHALATTTGSWTDADGDSLAYSYQWYRADDNSGTNLAAIGGATNASYTLTTSDAHKYLRVVVTANDGNGGTQSAASAYTAILNSAPVNSAAPSISGTATVGNALSTTNGTWSDADGDGRTYSYQWYRADDNSGTNLALIAGATSASYTLTTSDAHKYLRVVVTANDGNGGTQTATSAYTQVTNSAPVNSVAPSISGTATVDNALSTTNGTWSDADGDGRTYSYQWYRADDNSGTNLAMITGATSASYTLTTSDAHKYLRVVVTANDGNGGTQTATSAYAQVTNSAPVNSVAPTISGTATVGNALTTTNGTWSDADGDSRSYSYQWYRADDGSGTNLALIAGATTASYTLTTSDAHKYLRVVVTANDGNGGTQTASSAYTAVTNAPPTDMTLSNNSVSQRAGVNAVVGSLSSVDPDGDNAFTYSFATGSGDTDNASFNLSGAALRVNDPALLTAGNYSVRLRTTDGSGGTFEKEFAVTIAASLPPTIGGTPPSAVARAQAYSFTPTASSPEGDPLTFSIVNQPAWASFDPATGTLSGTPTLAHVGTTTSGIVISVSDGWLTASLAPFSIAVTEHPAVPPSGGWGGLGDNDADGIPDAVETLVPSVDGVSRGDGNGDGTPDVGQDHVTSIPWARSPSGQLSFVTLSNASGLAQTGVSTTLPAAGDLPANLAMPYGLLSFEVNGVAPLGGAVSFSVYVDANAPVDGYYKKSSASGNWENIATGITTVGARKRIDFTLTDGDPFDTDGLANGRIVDPGGPGMMGAAAALTPIPLLSPWAMAALAALMAGGAGVAGGRRRRH